MHQKFRLTGRFSPDVAGVVDVVEIIFAVAIQAWSLEKQIPVDLAYVSQVIEALRKFQGGVVIVKHEIQAFLDNGLNGTHKVNNVRLPIVDSFRPVPRRLRLTSVIAAQNRTEHSRE